MKQRLCIGIQRFDEDWQHIFDQLGLWIEEINYNEISPQYYSAILLNQKPDALQKEKLTIYIAAGGSVLECFDIASFHFSGERNRVKKRYIVNEVRHPALEHVPYLDLAQSAYLRKDSTLFDGLLQFLTIQNGCYAFFGVNLPAQLKETGYTRKRFFNPFGVNPDELVNKVSKHELMLVFEAILKELHFKRNLPFIKKWESPSKKPVFCFRIDSDYGDKDSVQKLQQLSDKYEIPATWFLHVQAHEQWLEQFMGYQNQEIALHGYQHVTTTSYSKAAENIKSGKDKLEASGLFPSGFCAPYGIWNKALSRVLSEMDFIYSSEFTFVYDGFPIQTAADLPLQIPIHPICPGSLNRHRQNETEINTYFDFVIHNKLSRFEPVLLYHHPLQKGIENVEHIFKRANAENLEKLSFGEYAEFWKSRKKDKAEYYLTDSCIEINAKGDRNHWLYIALDHDSFDLIPFYAPEIKLGKSAEFKYMKQYLPDTEQIEKLHKKDLKIIKTTILDWKNREKL